MHIGKMHSLRWLRKNLHLEADCGLRVGGIWNSAAP
nr:MAG TPA: hypothetical protein [Caudoviricetes sp.]